MHRYVLLTGSTGLLGQYLLRDLTAAGVRVAVVVRPSRSAPPRARIDALMARWDRTAGRLLQRPVVIEGDLTAPGLGLSPADRDWVGRGCSTVLHNAASLSFESGGPRTEEPWLSNVTGTTNVVDLARGLGIRQFHHVSTAYVCGLRQGRILETDGDQGQRFGNDYEASKLEAESIVRRAGFADPPTVYRPAIIIGDSKTSFTSTYHGFYTPLRVMASLLPALSGVAPIPEESWLAALGLKGPEGKNLVPVDWVSRVITHIFTTERWRGRTYHLTPTTRVPVREIARVTKEALMARLASRPPEQGRHASVLGAIDASFRDQMLTYSAYWRDDPVFDTANTRDAAGHLPCPAVDAALLRRLCDFALDENFGWPRPSLRAPAFDLHAHFRDSGVTVSDAATDPGIAELAATGPGGGRWTLYRTGSELRVGPPAAGPVAPRVVVHASTDTLAAVHRGETTARREFLRGGLVVAGANGHADDLVAVVQLLCGAAEVATS